MHDEDEPSAEASRARSSACAASERSDGSVEFHLPHGELDRPAGLPRLHGPRGSTSRRRRGRHLAPPVRDGGRARAWPAEETGSPASGSRHRPSPVRSCRRRTGRGGRAPGPAAAADPGRWRLAQADSVPPTYFQGLTARGHRRGFFDGIPVGLYRTDRDLRQNARDPDALPPAPRGAGLQPHRRPRRGTRARAGACCCRWSATSPERPTAATRAGAARSPSPIPRR